MLIREKNVDSFRKTVELLDDLIIMARKETITFVNNSCTRITGYEKNALLGRELSLLIPREHVEKIQDVLQKEADTRDVIESFPIDIRAKNGTCVRIEAKIAVMGEEMILMARVPSRDDAYPGKMHVTDKHVKILLELAIKNGGTTDLQEILQNCVKAGIKACSMDSGGIYVIHPNGDLELAASSGLSSRYLEKVSFFRSETEVARRARSEERIYTEADDRCVQFDDEMHDEGLTSSLSFPVRNDGKVIARLNLASKSMVIIPRETRDFLEIMTSNLGNVIIRAESESFKRQFLALMTHELKTPLTLICGATELLDIKATTRDPVVSRAVDHIKRGSNRLKELIDTILDYSLIETGNMALTPQKFDLVPVIKDVVYDMSYLADRKKIQIATRFPESLEIVADKFRIGQVLVNLLSNAIKYTPLEGHVNIVVEVIKDFTEIMVIDDGLGITSQELAFLFTKYGRFERKDQGVEIKGTGLGLYIARGIVELHSGHIWAESEGRGKGSRFIFRIPIGISAIE
ncbi:MAG: ATP-binding protein [Candidatus Sigynarchaeota archaeon]